MKLLCVSDLRTQPIALLERVVEKTSPELLVYAGDDVARLGSVDDETLVDAAARVLERVGRDTTRLNCADGRFGVANVSWGWLPTGAYRRVVLGPDRPGEYTLHAVALGVARWAPPTGLWSRRQINGWDYALRVVRRPPMFDAFRRLARSIPFGVAGVLGNDGHPLERHILRESGWDLHGAPLTLSDATLLGLEGAPSRDLEHAITMGERAAEIHLRVQSAVALVDRPKVLVSHAPPLGTLDLAVGAGLARVGWGAVRDLLGEVDVVICGHCHRLGGRVEEVSGTTVVNVASHEAPDAPLVYALIDVGPDGISVELGEEYEGRRLTALLGVGPAGQDALHLHGVTDLETVANPPSDRTLERALGPVRAVQAHAHARALLSGRPVWLGQPEPLPDGLVYLDVEASLYDRSDVWLVGVADGEQPVQQFVEGPDAAHLDALDAFMAARPAHMIGAWTSYDRSALHSAFARAGREAPDWLRSDRWLDLHAWARRFVRLPIRTMRLDDVARHLGFRPRHQDLDGMLVGMLRQRQLHGGEPLNAKEVLEYNADDVEAMRWVVASLGAARSAWRAA